MRLFIAFLVICCVGCSQSSRYQFSLKGNIEGVKYGTVFLMTPGDSSIVLYKTDLEGGKFELKGELDEPTSYIESEPTPDLFLYGWHEYGNFLPLFGIK